MLLSITMSVEALESKEISRQDGVYAVADWSDTNGNVTTYTYLSVDKTNEGTYVSISMSTYDSVTDSYSDKYGSVYTRDDIFIMDKKLDSASLSPVEIAISEWYYDETEDYFTSKDAGTLTVSADWTGIGDLSRGSFKHTSRDGDYIFRSAENSLSRDASITASIDGNFFESQYYASMVSFKSARMSMNK